MFQWIRLRINKASQYGLFFKKQKVFKTKNKDHHLSNGRDVHKHFVCCIFEKCLQWIYHPAHQINQIHQINIFIIKYIIKYFSYLHISSKVLRHIIDYIIIYIIKYIKYTKYIRYINMCCSTGLDWLLFFATKKSNLIKTMIFLLQKDEWVKFFLLI